jgi:alcohol dehydrogenase (cytochrome c)
VPAWYFSGSDEGNFFALDAHTGAPASRLGFPERRPHRGESISFAIDSRQVVAVAAGRLLYVFEVKA